MEYKVLTASSAEDLTRCVTAALQDGWKLYGEMSVSSVKMQYRPNVRTAFRPDYYVANTFAQAVTREFDPSKCVGTPYSIPGCVSR